MTPLVMHQMYIQVHQQSSFTIKGSNIGPKFTSGSSVLFSKGYNVQDLFLKIRVQCQNNSFYEK